MYKCKERTEPVWKICVQLVSFKQFFALCVRVKGKMVSWREIFCLVK